MFVSLIPSALAVQAAPAVSAQTCSSAPGSFAPAVGGRKIQFVPARQFARNAGGMRMEAGGGSSPASVSPLDGAEDDGLAVRRSAPNRYFQQNSFYGKFVDMEKPRNILEEIVWNKDVEVDRARQKVPLDVLRRKMMETPPPPVRNFLEALKTAGRGNSRVFPALIAEVKKASPSKGVLRADFEPVEIAGEYVAAGASCMSVLTDEKYFQGSFEYLRAIRDRYPDTPLLCKDFMISPYQFYVARQHGADAVLLIAAVLPDKDLQYFLKIAKALEMTALIEVHTLQELDRVLALEGVELVGINNRNLQDFSVTLKTTEDILAARLQTIKERGILMVSESGLHTPEDLARVVAAGCSAVLIGESLVTKPSPGDATRALFTGAPAPPS